MIQHVVYVSAGPLKFGHVCQYTFCEFLDLHKPCQALSFGAGAFCCTHRVCHYFTRLRCTLRLCFVLFSALFPEGQ